MNLKEYVEQYVRYHQSLGKQFETQSRLLGAFVRKFDASKTVETLTSKEVETYIRESGTSRYWYIKYSTLEPLFRYGLARGDIQRNPLPPDPPTRGPKLQPYIYSKAEIRRLLEATERYQKFPGTLEPITVRTLILLTYGGALRAGEVRRLNREDVSLDDSLITVRDTKFYKSRLVPISAQVTEAMRAYLFRDSAQADGDAPAFTKRTGGRMATSTVTGHFRRVCAAAGIRRDDGGRFQPRLHDLRHSFAVHRLVQWYREGQDVQDLLPHLSVFLGHTQLAATQIYLSMTPQLLQEASQRFETYAFPETSHA